ncbi:hypothetical protein HANVADRAFT_49159 [Hanseniaspora valbyensis NRRL Y-1626]|uniref:Uncharacterized protein n=1 Tax=Hanseniaspora valbyensis NRRL Y-1626 TaxID=766949 RepID=A0A1B7TCE6_9ASCO|nr:hypothetical protein HANVADRAFT_49159 [Hanseniaspora valbyensis NRRL Y-1626]
MNNNSISNLFNITDTSHLNNISNNNINKNSDSSIMDNDFEDISKDIDERVATIRNKIINDLIKQRLFENKQRQIEEYTIKEKDDNNSNSINGGNVFDLIDGVENNINNNDDDKIDREIKELEEKLEQIDSMIEFAENKKKSFQQLKAKNEQIFKEDINKFKQKIQELQNNIENDLLHQVETKENKIQDINIEKKFLIKTAQIKSQMISKLLQLQVLTEANDKVKFLFDNKYHIVLHKKLDSWKLIEWEPRNKIYTMSLSERRQIEDSFQKMDLKSWIINIRDLLLR